MGIELAVIVNTKSNANSNIDSYMHIESHYADNHNGHGH